MKALKALRRRPPTRPQGPYWAQLLHHLGSPVLEQIHTGIDIAALFVKTLYRVPQPRCWRRQEILQSIVQNGIGSLPSITITTAIAGVVVTHQIAWHMKISLHDVSMIPGFSGQFILRELGIAIPAMLVVSKAGASITAEVGSMKITEQIDALKLLGIDPITYLVFPRFIAALISGACLTLIAISITLACSAAVTIVKYHLSVLEFLNALRHFVGVNDLFCALIKGVIFGAVIPIISCTYGFRCRGGAEGVGSATTNSVVTATIAIIILDFVLTYFFTFVF